MLRNLQIGIKKRLKVHEDCRFTTDLDGNIQGLVNFSPLVFVPRGDRHVRGNSKICFFFRCYFMALVSEK